MASTSEIKAAAADALNNIVSSGIIEHQEGAQRFKRVNPGDLLDLMDRLDAREAEDAGSRVFKPLVEDDI